MRKMKDSRIEWIGEIPKDWNMVPYKRIMHKIKAICEHYNGEDIISLTMNGVIKRDLTAGGKMPTSFDGYQYVEPEDLLLCLFDIDVTPRCVGIVRDYGVTSPAYSRFRVHDGYSNRYYDYLLRAIDDDKVFVHLSKNLRSSLTETDFGAIKTCAPPLTEQGRIAAFLDAECAEIDAVLEKTRASIDEYKKLKQAVITQTVTKGIRGDRPMKDSGIEWIDKIPKEWKSIRLKNLFEFGKGLSITKDNLIDEGIPVISYGQIHSKQTSGVELQPHLFRYVDKNYLDSNPQSIVHSGDFIFADTSEDLEGCGNAVFVSKEMNLFAGYHTIILVNKKSLSNKYYAYLFRSDLWRSQIRSKVSGVKLFSISKKILSDAILLVPTDNEMNQIVNYLDAKCAEIDNLISKKEQYINEIENYKKSLIYEYVTGKKECPAMVQNEDVTNAYPYFPAPVHASSARFAQAVLMSKILEESSKGMGRVKLEKTLFTIENHIGFDFDTEYFREAAGPLDASIYECEKIITRRNKWFSMKTSSYGVSYAPTNDVDKYKKYYAKYFSEYNSEIERIIDVFRNYTTEQAEIIATLFAAWNDAIIDKKQFADDDIVDDVLNNWHESKRRFPRQVWLRAMNEIRKNHIIPKGYGKHTVMKEMQ